MCDFSAEGNLSWECLWFGIHDIKYRIYIIKVYYNNKKKNIMIIKEYYKIKLQKQCFNYYSCGLCPDCRS